MFKRSAVKKYGNKLLPRLQQRYGEQTFYNPSQVRSTVYQCDFNPNFLPLGYLLFLEKNAFKQIISNEFPQLCINSYKQELRAFLNEHKYYGHLKRLTVKDNERNHSLAG